MDKKLILNLMLIFMLGCIVAFSGTTSLAKTKTINYQEEFPQYLQSAIVEQGIDKNSDGKLSGIEINAVTTLTLRQYGESKKYNSLKKITVFKNLKKLHIDSGCRVKKMNSLHSLKKLEVLEIDGYEYEVLDATLLEFSKMKSLRVLKSPLVAWGNVLDLRKCKKIKTVVLPEENSNITVYLPNKAVDFGDTPLAEYKVYFCQGKKKKKGIWFEERFSGYADRSYVARGKEYTIQDFGVCSLSSNMTLKSYVKRKNIKWKCTSKNVKIRNGKVKFKKNGIYTLIGFAKNKTYILHCLCVVEPKYEKLVFDCNKMSVSTNLSLSGPNKGNTLKVDIIEPAMITQVISLINEAGYTFDYDLTTNEGPLNAPRYVVSFYDANWKTVKEIVVEKDMLKDGNLFYRGDKGVTARLIPYLESLIPGYEDKWKENEF